jgi:NADPH:quinone reductase-like Zn-dependent oxidoreductase
VTRYAPGDDVFGSVDHGAYAELLRVPEDGALAHRPTDLTPEQAAATPYGAGTALHFLRDVARVQPGEAVLVLGATGGVGRFAVQLAKHLGAEVTAVCSGANAALARELGADHVVDYTADDFRQGQARYDVIFDIADATSFRACRAALTPSGRYLTLYASLNVLGYMAWTALTGGRRAYTSVALDTRERTEDVRALVERGVFRPVVAQRFPLERIVDAHQAVETGSQVGAVVVSVQAA